MNPGQAWKVVSLMVVLVVAVGAALSVDMGYDSLAVVLVSAIVLIIYPYVLYKRYHVEVVPESDIALFDDPDDLRILCRIYGLYTDGDEADLRRRLVKFVRTNSAKAFTWVAPKAVLGFGSTFELSAKETASTKTLPADKGLICGKERSESRRATIVACPVCDAPASAGSKQCRACGADLEFYSALSETKIGRRLLSSKGTAVRRKLRYSVPSLGETR